MNGAARDEERDRIKKECRQCRHCAGMGFVAVFHPDYTGSSVVELEDHDRGIVRVAGRVASHCVCRYGRWMREKLHPDLREFIPDYQACLDGESFYLADDPTETEEMVQLRGGREAVRRMAARVGTNVGTKARRGED